MTDFNDVMPHGPIQELFPDVFFVTGTMKAEFFGSDWQFSRNMTVVREGEGGQGWVFAVTLIERDKLTVV